MQKYVVAAAVIAAIAIGFYFFVLRDTFDPNSVRDKRVLVTGASTGIGEQLAYQYSKFGARLILTARREKVLQEVAVKCRHLGAAQVEIVPADMANASERETVIEETLKRLKGVDYVVLNHVISYPGFWLGNDKNLTDLQKLFEVNFVAYVHLASKLMESLDESGGSLAIVSSVAGNVAMPKFASYSSSKFALQGFFSALRQELIIRQKNASVTICVLGLIDTESAMVATKEHTPKMDVSLAAPAADAALAIIKAVTAKVNIMYFPLAAYLGVMGHKFFPTLIDYIVRGLI